MTLPSSIIDAQVQRLLDVVAQYQTQQQQQIMAEAQRQAHAIVRSAYHEARVMVRKENTRNRERLQRETARARARHQTAVKQQLHTRDQQFLNDAWRQLEISLRARWQQESARKTWIANILNYGAKALPVSQWRVDLGPGYDAADLQHIAQQVQVVTGQEPQLRDAPDGLVGIKIQAMGAIVDGTLTGLLQDRADIEAQLLAAYHTTSGPAPNTSLP